MEKTRLNSATVDGSEVGFLPRPFCFCVAHLQTPATDPRMDIKVKGPAKAGSTGAG